MTVKDRDYSSHCKTALRSLPIALGLFLLFGIRPADAQVQAFSNAGDLRTVLRTLIAKAPNDECFAKLSNPPLLPRFTDPANCAQYGTNPPAKPKVNQSYIWGITENGDSL